ncbi:TetR/AcrR family transcriptional regulator [Herbiconiux sp. UC225_62]|uniref:TetR/AcrR family transcriptional regulator n=1 Tax=Herbiconiux sp. UC225_62 TaxID=3350168 RepID=UPI0036D31E6E
MIDRGKRSGIQTRHEIQDAALTLFSAQGYDATSLREIAERVGISKAALYYHFRSKDEIVASVLRSRGDEAEELLDWVRSQPPAPDLLERAVLRWVDSFTVDKLRGIRFVTANPAVMRSVSADAGGRIRDGLAGVVEFFAGGDASGPHDPTRVVLVRMAFLSINAAVAASAGTGASDDDVVAAAREASLALLTRLGASMGGQ